MRVVLDTNILISGLVSPTGPASRVLQHWRDRKFILICSERQLDEFRAVTRYNKLRSRVTSGAAGNLLNRVKSRATIVERLPDVRRSPDPDDDFLLAMAEAGRADRLVSGDRAGLLALGSHGPTRIVTLRAFTDEFDI